MPGDSDEPERKFPEQADERSVATPPVDGRGGGSDHTERPSDRQPDAAPGSLAGEVAGRGRALFVLAGVVGLVAVLLLGVNAVGLWPQWRNPFAQQQTDRTQPPLLKSIQDLSRYVAAEGNFQVVVDLQKDRRYVPDFLLNQRTLFVGAGSVEAYVDFGTIGDGAVVESADGQSVEIRLPAPQLGEAKLDLDNSYVFAEQRGLINRLGEVFGGDPDRQREVYQLAEERIAAAARDSGLGERAQDNTRKMLESLLRSLGYQNVTITYIAP